MIEVKLSPAPTDDELARAIIDVMTDKGFTGRGWSGKAPITWVGGTVENVPTGFLMLSCQIETIEITKAK